MHRVFVSRDPHDMAAAERWQDYLTAVVNLKPEGFAVQGDRCCIRTAGTAQMPL